MTTAAPELSIPTTLGDALGALNSSSVVIAGGTDLVPMLQAGHRSVETLIDVSRLGELRGIRLQTTDGDAALRMGPTTTMAEIADIAERLGPNTAIADSAALVGSLQTRNVATLGGNICRASPSGDTLAPVLVCGGEMQIQSAAAQRTVAAADFFTGPGCTILQPDELLTSIRFPRWTGSSAYRRVTGRPWMDLATVGVAVSLVVGPGDPMVIDSIRVAISGAAPKPVLDATAIGTDIGHIEQAIAAALPRIRASAQDVISPIDDVRSSARYRRKMVDRLIEDVAEIAVHRLKAGRPDPAHIPVDGP